MGVETELLGLKNRYDGKEFRVIEREDGIIAVLAGDTVVVDSGVTPVTAAPSGSGVAAGAGPVLSVGSEIEVGEAPAARDTSRKLLYRQGADDLRVITRTARGKLLQWTMRKGVFDDGATSLGVQSDWWRLLRLTELINAYVFRTGAPDAETGTWTTGSTSMYPGADSSERYQVQSRRSTVQGSSATYNITVPSSGRVGVVVGVTASTPTAVTVTCGAVSQTWDYREANDGQTGTARCKVLWLTGCTPGAGSVVVTLTTRESGQTMYLFGPIIADLSQALPATIPASSALVATFNLSDVLVGTASNGGSDIAIHDSDADKWMGSYHGGHKSSAEFLDGSAAIDVSTTGALVVAVEPRIIQQGDLGGKLACSTEHRWSSPSELALSGVLQGSVNSARAYVAMATTRADWTMIDGIERAAASASEIIGRKSSIWQQKPGDTSRTIYIRAHDAVVNGQPTVPYVEQWVSGSTYAKTRLGVLDTQTVQAINRIDFVTALGIAHS